MKSSLIGIFAALVLSFFVFQSFRTKKDASFVSPAPEALLVFTKTAGYKHSSIPDGVKALQGIAKENNWRIDTTADASFFTEDQLKKYKAVIFLSTTGDVLNDAQQTAFENYMKSGGGYVGVHAATDTEYDWPWYNNLVGAYFLSHPKQQKATVVVKDKKHLSTSFLPDRWERFDEWYNFKSIVPGIKVLATLDESTYEGGKNGDHHPITWYHEAGGGRAWYTGLGHTAESYSEPLFLRHLTGGIRYAMGQK